MELEQRRPSETDGFESGLTGMRSPGDLPTHCPTALVGRARVSCFVCPRASQDRGL